MDRMQHKVAFITGAARGQGKMHALRLAEEGADIIGVDICRQIPSVPFDMATHADLHETCRQVEALGRRMFAKEADVRDPIALRSALDEGVTEMGGLDVVVANAGIWSGAPAAEITMEAWRDMIDVNLTGVWNTCQVSLKHLVEGGKGGSMILISSTAGLRGAANCTHYGAAKHGVVGIMRALAKEMAPQNIRVNSVHPTTVGTDMVLNDPMYKVFRPDLEAPTVEDARPEFMTLNMLPVPWVEPIDVSNAVLFLASEESRYITSVALPVDAGASQR